MADCHGEFQRFQENIRLSSTQEENLRRGRDSLREKVKKYYADKELKQPTFHGQGSFKMRTTISQSEEDYDLDDGVFLKHLPEKKEDWPKTEDVHAEIVEAVDGHTDTPPKDKTSCVRVQYKSDYHIDLAIYGEEGDKTFLAKKGDEQWEENDPRLFKDWFADHLESYGEQFRSICKYIKKWAYYNGYSQISGFLITILVGNNFVDGYDDRDDEALEKTLVGIVDDLSHNRCINRPVDPKKNMTSEFSDDDFQKLFINRFTSFRDMASEAVSISDKEKACEKWRKLFGDDFPKGENDEQDGARSKGPAKITSETRPWGK
jgi:hypothetical protein